jgi:F0F1-type ATP synthase membrane subunit b/b'
MSKFEEIDKAQQAINDAKRERQRLIQQWHYEIAAERKELELKMSAMLTDFADKHNIPKDSLSAHSSYEYIDDAMSLGFISVDIDFDIN